MSKKLTVSVSFILQALQVRRSRTKTVILLQSVLLKRLQAFFHQHHHLRLQKKRRHLPVNLLLTTSARRRHHLRQPIRPRLTASHQPRRQAPNKTETPTILTRETQERILNNKMTATKSSIQIRMLLFCCYQPFISLKYLHSKLNGHVSHFGFRARH